VFTVATQRRENNRARSPANEAAQERNRPSRDLPDTVGVFDGAQSAQRRHVNRSGSLRSFTARNGKYALPIGR